jgi:hypothetical protein
MEFNGLFNEILKYMSWALAFYLVQACSHELMGPGAFFFVGFKSIKYTQ